jgi:hypothetical protein
VKTIFEYDIRRWGLGFCAGRDNLCRVWEVVIGLGPFTIGIEWE